MHLEELDHASLEISKSLSASGVEVGQGFSLCLCLWFEFVYVHSLHTSKVLQTTKELQYSVVIDA